FERRSGVGGAKRGSGLRVGSWSCAAGEEASRMIVQALGEPSLLGAGEPSTNRLLTDAESNSGGTQGEAKLSVLERHLGSRQRSKRGISVHVFRAGRRWAEC